MIEVFEIKRVVNLKWIFKDEQQLSNFKKRMARLLKVETEDISFNLREKQEGSCDKCVFAVAKTGKDCLCKARLSLKKSTNKENPTLKEYEMEKRDLTSTCSLFKGL